jgi:Cation efflux family
MLQIDPSYLLSPQTFGASSLNARASSGAWYHLVPTATSEMCPGCPRRGRCGRRGRSRKDLDLKRPGWGPKGREFNLAAPLDAGSYPSHVEHASVELPVATVSGGTRREPLVRRARFLAALGLAWHLVEAAVALIAGLAAGSIALVGFGADSVVEGAAGAVVLWRFSSSRAASDVAERRAQQLIGVSFFAIAAYVGVEAVRTLLAGDHPDSSWVGIGLAVVTMATMPPLAAAKARVGERLNSAATRSEGRQNLLCAYLSAALLVGLVANAALGWWWADPAAALVIAVAAVDEGRDAWRGEGCTDGCC